MCESHNCVRALAPVCLMDECLHDRPTTHAHTEFHAELKIRLLAAEIRIKLYQEFQMALLTEQRHSHRALRWQIFNDRQHNLTTKIRPMLCISTVKGRMRTL